MSMLPEWVVTVAIVALGWIFGSIFWAKGQSGRIDTLEATLNSRIDRVMDRVKNCEDKANQQGESWQRLDDRLQSMDSKLNRLMGRLGVPHRAGDLEESV